MNFLRVYNSDVVFDKLQSLDCLDEVLLVKILLAVTFAIILLRHFCDHAAETTTCGSISWFLNRPKLHGISFSSLDSNFSFVVNIFIIIVLKRVNIGSFPIQRFHHVIMVHIVYFQVMIVIIALLLNKMQRMVPTSVFTLSNLIDKASRLTIASLSYEPLFSLLVIHLVFRVDVNLVL